ncbi:MAG: hypothetical protein ACI4N3_01535 [Alphaproteobacteria bacterium]
MYIESKYIIDQMNNLYNFILNKQHSLSDIFQYYFNIDNINETEKEFVYEVNSLISIIDIEFGDAELENRIVNTQLMNNTLRNILNLLNYWRYFVKININQYSSVLGISIKEYIYLFKDIRDKNLKINLNTILNDGINNFKLNTITIVGFLIYVLNELKKDNLIDKLFYDNEDILLKKLNLDINELLLKND